MGFVERMLVDVFIFVMSMTGIIGAWKLLSQLINRRRFPETGLRAIEERLAHLEQVADTTAIEVERISEGLRFTTRLLAERTGMEAPPSSSSNSLPS